MADRTTVEWLNGQHFEVVTGPPSSVTWSDVPGAYIFAGLNTQRLWLPVYVGQTASLAGRLPTHERWQEAARLGATHIHAKVVQHPDSRTRFEVALIQKYAPPLNKQYAA